jgi:hypothetical protein
VREQAANYCRCISAEPEEVLRLKRARGAHDVSPETSYRWHLLSSKNVRVNCVGKVESSIQVLVYLQIEIFVLSADFRVIVYFRKESTGPQDDAWQAARSGKELAKVLGRLLCHPIDVSRNRIEIFIDPRRGLTFRWRQRAAEGAGRAAEHNTGNAAFNRSLEDGQRSSDVGFDESLP